MDIIEERNDMEEITHFSHKKHPLKLLKSNEIVGAHFDGHGSGADDEKLGVIVCYACKNHILSGFAYGCIQCRYYLHKACTQLPATVNLPTLYEHPLTLIRYRTAKSRSWICDVCRNQNFGGFCYSFRKPQYHFTACIPCCVSEIARKAETDFIKEEAKIKVEHRGHPQHTLTLQLRPGAFLCDACNTKDEGLFYACDSCDFWIHKTCANLDPTLNIPDLDKHPLVLVYSLPENFFQFPYYCEFCTKYIRRNEWLYHCANCRYFSHIKCALNAKRPFTPSDAQSSSIADESVKDLLQFPMSKAFTDPLKLLHSEMIAPDYDKRTTINHWSHRHPLTLNVERQPNLSDSCDQLEVCDGCVRPLSLPYYSCKDGCSFTLHKYCAELPLKLKHQLHPDHSLHLINTRGLRYYCACIGCDKYGNSFLYRCQTCKFYLDVNCAFLPKTIKHKSHKHPLVQVIDPQPLCSMCKKWSEKMSYACKDCNFILSMYCAMRLPNSLVHRYCKGHEIPLAYPPVMDHPEEFFCDICETEMHPKHPLYYCPICKNSFHLWCISNKDFYENIVHRGIRIVSSHKHPLTYIRRKRTPKYVCSKCNRDNNGRLVLECRARVCNFNICFHCCRK